MMEDKALPVSVEGNKSVNKDILKEAHDFAARLEKIGVQPSKGYSIEPALGGKLTPIPPHINLPTESTGQTARLFIPKRQPPIQEAPL
jgi:hypothetical protein